MTNFLAVGIGGALGSMLRYFISLVVRFHFPWATLVANLAGSAILGFLAGSAFFMSEVRPTIRLMLMVGFCGGFTTFSTFSFQTFDLLQNGRILEAAGNILLNIAGCLVFTFLGYWLAKSMLSSF